MALPVVLEDQVLKMHTAKDGLVWYVDGGHGAINTQAPIEDFMEDETCRRARHVRMVGSPVNARALCAMYARKAEGQLLRLEVASPALVGRTRAERDDPQLMLVRMRDSAADGLSPAMGGWHEFDAADYPSYAIAACDDCGPDAAGLDEFRARMVMAHPAWPALSFIPHLNPARLALLLGIVLDPRWYTSLRTPRKGDDVVPYHDDAAKLHAYLGLDPRTMAGVLGAGKEVGSAARCRLVLETWVGMTPMQPELNQHPGNFLWRRYLREEGHIKGTLRASQLFVDYLRLVWLDAIYCDRVGTPAAPGKRPRQEGLFAPDHFFVRGDESAAYLRHRDAVAAG